MAIVQILIPEQTIAERWAMVTVCLAAAYNIGAEIRRFKVVEET